MYSLLSDNISTLGFLWSVLEVEELTEIEQDSVHLKIAEIQTEVNLAGASVACIRASKDMENHTLLEDWNNGHMD